MMRQATRDQLDRQTSAETPTRSDAADRAQPDPGQPRRTAALQVRRWFLIAAPVLAGLFAILGAAADPAVGAEGEVLWRAYAANPEPLQFKSFGFHWSYTFWLVPAIMIAGLIRGGRGVWIANVAALLGFVGISTLPGLLISDFFESAIGQAGGVEMNAAVSKIADEMWGVKAIITPGILSFVLAPPIAALAAWRAGIVRWWAPLAVVAGFVAFAVSSVDVWGTVLTTLFFSVFAYELARGTRAPQREEAKPLS